MQVAAKMRAAGMRVEVYERASIAKMIRNAGALGGLGVRGAACSLFPGGRGGCLACTLHWFLAMRCLLPPLLSCLRPLWSCPGPSAAEKAKTPLMCVVGAKEAEAGTLAVRLYGGADCGSLPADEVVAKMAAAVAGRRKFEP